MHHSWKNRRLESERACCYFIENNLKSGGWDYHQWKLKDNFQSKSTSGSLGLEGTPVLKDKTYLRCSPVLWSASVTPSRISQLAGIYAAWASDNGPWAAWTPQLHWESFGKVLTGSGQIMPGIVLAIYWYRQSNLKTQECILALLNLLVKTKPLVPHSLNN